MVKQINKTINHSFLISRLDKLPTVTTILQYDSAAQLNMYKLSGDEAHAQLFQTQSSLVKRNQIIQVEFVIMYMYQQDQAIMQSVSGHTETLIDLNFHLFP